MPDYLKIFFGHYKCRAALLLILSLIVMLSLITYKQSDPSLNLATNYVPHNLLGAFGANLADLLYQFFGISAFIFPISFFTWGCLIFIRGKLHWPYFKLTLIIVAASILCAALTNFTIGILPIRPKGIIGIFLLPVITEFIGMNSAVISWLSFLGIILFVLGLGLHPDYYINFFKNLRKLGAFRTNISDTGRKNKSAPNIISSSKIAPVIIEEEKSPSIFQNFIQKKVKTFPRENINAVRSPDNNILPDIDLLNSADRQDIKKESREQLQQNADELIKVLKDFGVKGQILDINQGPVVTLYEFEPAAGTKSSRVIGLSDDIARSLAAISTRISVISGRNVLGVELPNKHRAFFCLKELIATPEYQNPDILLPLILGKDLAGRPYIADLAKMPHLLVAGTTGSGKSVAINTMIMSLLYRYTPAECKMIMIDPKMLELSVYDNIPHLLTPVVTEAPKAVIALKWAVKEMENRYRLMSNIGVRNIAGYNAKIMEAKEQGKNLGRTVHTGFDTETGKATYETVQIELEKLPFIVVIVDEMADLMVVAGKDIEGSIQRLAQMARAAGIHIIMATQRPSVDVITGVIKANFPSRISFKVTSKIDSRTILAEQGAEQLLGMGDMLYMGNSSGIMRVHGPFVADSEVEKVTNYLKSLGTPEYLTAVTENIEEEEKLEEDSGSNGATGDEALYRQAVQIVKRDKKVSTSYIQRCLRIGYNKAATIVDKMEQKGIISAPNHAGKREILIDED